MRHNRNKPSKQMIGPCTHVLYYRTFDSRKNIYVLETTEKLTRTVLCAYGVEEGNERMTSIPEKYKEIHIKHCGIPVLLDQNCTWKIMRVQCATQ